MNVYHFEKHPCMIITSGDWFVKAAHAALLG